ncbi:O-antigen ligase family protein [Enterovibrio baiacu]|uniref:O-antigen ligase family protein n=1 Tax=Enterovibrio baiacu TaxID=2491023 RepID=UPI00138734C0|nr:O-antigen ligase family protein [Enterovibrio baiacu]
MTIDFNHSAVRKITSNMQQIKLSSIFDFFLVVLFSLSLITSKAGLYISSALLFIRFTHLVLSGVISWVNVKDNPYYFMPYLVYFSGISLCIISGNSVQDLAEYARKGSMILAIPTLHYLFQSSINRIAAISSISIGILLSILTISIKISENGWDGERISAFFDLGRSGEIIGYVIAFFIPLIYSKNKRIVFLSIPVIILSIIVLLMNGARAPLLSLFILIPIYLVIKKRRNIFHLALLLTLAIVSLNSFMPKTLNDISNRIQSIANIQTDPSNVARLKMWGTSFDFFIENISSSPRDAFFGSGPHGFKEKYKVYLESKYSIEKISTSTHSQFSYNDSHNMYLDLLNKHGIIYSLILASAFFSVFFSSKLSNNPLKDSIILVLFSFLITGLFYTSYMDFQTSFIYFIIALSGVSSLEEKIHE